MSRIPFRRKLCRFSYLRLLEKTSIKDFFVLQVQDNSDNFILWFAYELASFFYFYYFSNIWFFLVFNLFYWA